MEWEETLQEILAREALQYFKDGYADEQEFYKHMALLTGVHDWNETFLKSCYEKYMEKINIFGHTLNMNQQR